MAASSIDSHSTITAGANETAEDQLLAEVRSLFEVWGGPRQYLESTYEDLKARDRFRAWLRTLVDGTWPASSFPDPPWMPEAGL